MGRYASEMRSAEEQAQIDLKRGELTYYAI